MDLARLLAVSRGDAPADLVLRGGRVLCVFTGEILEVEVAISGSLIAGLGSGYRGRHEVDLEGRFLAPGLIDAHVHVESSLVPPRQFARAVVPCGVTTVITDPHEIASVLGIEGVRYMLRDAETVPLSMLVNVPSCVPASSLATGAWRLEADELAPLLVEPGVLGLAEVMSYPGVVAGDRQVLDKLDVFRGLPIDGHCPELESPALDAYVAAGISSDHESTSPAEAREKLRRGMTVFLREASCARDLDRLLPLVDRWSERQLCLCTDDRLPTELLAEGSIDSMVRRSIAAGVEPLSALRMATLNPASHYGLADRGAIAPGRRADLMVFSDLASPRAEQVFVSGELVAEDGQPRFRVESSIVPQSSSSGLDWSRFVLEIPACGARLRVIELIPDQLLTVAAILEARVEDGFAVSDPPRDLLKLAVAERHRGTGNVGFGFVRGFGLPRGALASTVAHDCHNLILVGADDASMHSAARAVMEVGGGLAVADGEGVVECLPLPIAGLMSDRPVEEVRSRLESLLLAARQLGSPLDNPFMALSFLALEVIPELKLSDLGLVEVERSRIVPLFVEGGARGAP